MSHCDISGRILRDGVRTGEPSSVTSTLRMDMLVNSWCPDGDLVAVFF